MTTPRRVAVLGAVFVAEIAGAGAAFSAASGVGYPTGLYWALTTASTVGYGDVAPHGAVARLVAIVVMLTAIPLLGAMFAALTSLHVKGHVVAAEERLHKRFDEARRADEGH